MNNQIKVELQDFMGNDRSISEAAWTSSHDYQKKQTRTDIDVKRVVKMLAESKHSVPFESIVLRFWIRMPIAIDRQWMTHRIASNSGMSGRYRTMPDDFLLVPDDVEHILGKAGDEIQDSTVEQYITKCTEMNEWYQSKMDYFKQLKRDNQISISEYKRLREFFRGVLPQHNMTERVSVMNLRSFANFYRLRSKLDAQPEIQQIANAMLEEIEKANICPIAIEALKLNNWNI